MMTRPRLPMVVALAPTSAITADTSCPGLVAMSGWVEGNGTSGGSCRGLLPRGTWGMRGQRVGAAGGGDGGSASRTPRSRCRGSSPPQRAPTATAARISLRRLRARAAPRHCPSGGLIKPSRAGAVVVDGPCSVRGTSPIHSRAPGHHQERSTWRKTIAPHVPCPPRRWAVPPPSTLGRAAPRHPPLPIAAWDRLGRPQSLAPSLAQAPTAPHSHPLAASASPVAARRAAACRSQVFRGRSPPPPPGSHRPRATFAARRRRCAGTPAS